MLFVLEDYVDEEACPEVHAIAPDGTDDEVIYVGERRGRRRLCHRSEQVSDGAVVTPERLCYVDSHYDEGSGDAPGTVYALDYDSSSVETVYQSERGKIGDIALGGGSLYAWEADGEGDEQAIVIASENGQYQGSVGGRVIVMGRDGTSLVEYQLTQRGTGR